ncbi:MAG: hypothetical protein JWL98_83, partial [Xanthomonadaceae bacterium]|nr:hypothetical protein [Xanthomonadaceae bacterium]
MHDRDRNQAAAQSDAPMLTRQSLDLDWSKENGLIPAIIQDARNGRVLMLGYMN